VRGWRSEINVEKMGGDVHWPILASTKCVPTQQWKQTGTHECQGQSGGDMAAAGAAAAPGHHRCAHTTHHQPQEAFTAASAKTKEKYKQKPKSEAEIVENKVILQQRAIKRGMFV